MHLYSLIFIQFHVDSFVTDQFTKSLNIGPHHGLAMDRWYDFTSTNDESSSDFVWLGLVQRIRKYFLTLSLKYICDW